MEGSLRVQRLPLRGGGSEENLVDVDGEEDMGLELENLLAETVLFIQKSTTTRVAGEWSSDGSDSELVDRLRDRLWQMLDLKQFEASRIGPNL